MLASCCQFMAEGLPGVEVLGAISQAEKARSRVAAAATSRIEPRSTSAGDAPLRPVARRS